MSNLISSHCTSVGSQIRLSGMDILPSLLFSSPRLCIKQRNHPETSTNLKQLAYEAREEWNSELDPG